jgi:murein DD-endopeptidase MepM/ murein hydrolase activator NlpD
VARVVVSRVVDTQLRAGRSADGSTTGGPPVTRPRHLQAARPGTARHAAPRRRHVARHARPDADDGLGLGLLAATATLSVVPLVLGGPGGAGASPTDAVDITYAADSPNSAPVRDDARRAAAGVAPGLVAARSAAGIAPTRPTAGPATTAPATPAATAPATPASRAVAPRATPESSKRATAARATAARTTAARATAARAAQERARDARSRTSRDARHKPAPAAWVHPMPGASVTSCYGGRWGVLHAGVDLAAPAGTRVRAVGAGRVVSAGWNYPGYGISVLINHGNGTLTHYAHLSAANVRPGDRVAAGKVIGREGSTGDSTGPHLHFEVHRGRWHQINPTPWLARRGISLPC